ncbi:MAG: HEAT repeat domain-containing protein, partial [Planctomycetota bacterium]|nr:HEAT repeat domain-containing protein [Planctomycetota bacterium]
VWIIRQLQLIGRAEVVPVLTGLLDDKEAIIRESARRALQYNPSAEAGAALRAALDKAADPAWKIAMINAVSQRKDASATAAIAKLAADKDEAIMAAALDGLGTIGTAYAAKAIAAVRATVPAKLKALATDDYLRCADQMLKDGQKDAAAAIYQAVYVPTEPVATRLAALRGLVLAKGASAVPMIGEVLAGKDEAMKSVALSCMQEIPGPEATVALVALIAKVQPADQATIIAALGRRGDPAGKTAVLAATKSTDVTVRMAAYGALRKLGGAAEVELLAQAAAKGQDAETDAARLALVQMSGKDVNAAMAAAVAKGDPKVRVEVIKAVAVRKTSDAASALVSAMGDADATVRLEAIKAVENIGNEQALPALIAALAKAQGEEQQAAEKSFLTVCARAANKDAALQAVLSALPGASTPARVSLIKALGKLGGPKALAAVKAALKDSDEAVHEAAVRSLADWPDMAAAPDLLAIAKTDAKEANQVLALRGYLRLAALPERTTEERISMCREALAVTKREDVKRLILGVLAEVNLPQALAMAMPMLEDNALKNEAAVAVVKIAKSLGNNVPAEAKPALEAAKTISKDKRVIADADEALKKIKPAKK